MHLLPVTACFAPPASPTSPSALPRPTQLDGAGIAARDVTRFAVGAGAAAAAGATPRYSGDHCQSRAAAANPSMTDALPHNVRTTSSDGRHSRWAGPVPQCPAGTSLAGTSLPRPTACKTRSSDAMPCNVTTTRSGRRLRRQAGALPRLLAGTSGPGTGPLGASGIQREKLGRNAIQRENRACPLPAPPTGRRRAATSGRHQPGRHQPVRANGVQREKLGRNAMQREDRAYRPPAPPTGGRRAATSCRLPGTDLAGSGQPGLTVSNARSSDAMPCNLRTARARCQLRRQAGAGPRLLAGTNLAGTTLRGPTASNARSSDAMPCNVRTRSTGRGHHRQVRAVPRRAAGTRQATTTASSARISETIPGPSGKAKQSQGLCPLGSLRGPSPPEGAAPWRVSGQRRDLASLHSIALP